MLITSTHKRGFKGIFSAKVLKADGSEKRFLNAEKTLKSGQPIGNLLLDNFFERVISMNDPVAFMSVRVGTGSTTPAVSQSALANQMTLLSGSWPVANPNFGVKVPSFIESGKLKASVSVTFNFALGQLSGNISELGVNMTSTGTASNTLVHARALVVDGGGNPTTITVDATEQLILTYTLAMEADAADQVYTVVADNAGVPTNIEVTSRWASSCDCVIYLGSLLGAGSGSQVYNGALNAFNVNPGGSFVTGPTPSPVHSSAAFSKDVVFNFLTAVGNVSGGISALKNNALNSVVKIGFNPPLPKDASKTLEIRIRSVYGRL